ncbi:hypothetical protein [Synechococcus sp. KORDI-100]|uniref:hypothetical protein n=1 Tax=Synechococcus sp. KORDI-100 TaxID=1280380 RepID=UPI000ACA3269|nr:hypothetical protein [Synechococcus sp. KORDI-100]
MNEPADLAMDESEPLPEEPIPLLEEWEGQTITMASGDYEVDWTLASVRKGKYKGCRIRTYRLDFASDNPEPFDGITEEMTVHSRRSKSSLRSTIDLKVDANGDGKYSKKENMLSSSLEGYKVKDQITDYVSYDFEVALSLRKLEPTGKIRFEWGEYQYGAPKIEFDSQGDGKQNSFNAYFSDPHAEELIVC